MPVLLKEIAARPPTSFPKSNVTNELLPLSCVFDAAEYVLGDNSGHDKTLSGDTVRVLGAKIEDCQTPGKAGSAGPVQSTPGQHCADARLTIKVIQIRMYIVICDGRWKNVILWVCLTEVLSYGRRKEPSTLVRLAAPLTCIKSRSSMTIAIHAVS